MRGTLITAIIGLVLAASPAWAGLFRTYKAMPGPEVDAEGNPEPMPLKLLRSYLSEYFLAEQAGTDTHAEYQKELRKLLSRPNLTDEDRINIGECYIRLGQPFQAIEVLTPATRTDFRACANIATAYHQLREYSRAIAYLNQALDLWPQEAPGFTPEQLKWLRKVEMEYRKLLYRRAAEANRQRPQAAETVDDLFGVRYVGADDKYEPGRIADEEKKKLPADAVPILQQMILWLPGDSRLYWQLGEVYNAQGNLEDARLVLDECLDNRRFSAVELVRHRQIVNEAYGRKVASEQANQARDRPSDSSFLPGTNRLVLVGGVMGLIVATLLFLQVREIRRRRMRGAPSSKDYSN